MPLTLSKRAQVVPQVKISPPENLVLDNFAIRPAATFNLRRTTRHYDGAMVTVRGTLSIVPRRVFKSDVRGDLDIRALLAFIGNGSGFIDRWNNPNDSSRDAVQATDARQPRIVSGGVLDVQNTKACMRQIATAMWLDLPNIMVGASSATGATAVTVYNQPTAGAAFSGWGTVNGDDQNVHSPWADSNVYDSFCSTGRQVFAAYGARDTLRTHTMRQTGTALQCFKNGTQIDTNKAATFKTTVTTISGNRILNGSPSNVYNSDDSMCESVFFGSALSTIDRQLLERDQAKYFSILGVI